MNAKSVLRSFAESLASLRIAGDEVVLVVNSMAELQQHGHGAMEYLDVLLDSVPAGTTLVFQTFNWDFCRGVPYHWRKTPSQTGLMSELFRRLDGVRRSPHPIYSVCALGDKAEAVCRHDGETCWGEGTPFAELLRANARIINVGREFPWGILLLHCFEELRRVPYRYFKSFPGLADFGDGPREYATRMYVRDLEKNYGYHWQDAVDVLLSRSQVAGLDLEFRLPSVRARDLEAACNECLDRDINIFLRK